MTSVLRCHFCGCDLDPNGDHYRHVQGWERPGRGIHDRSGSSLVLRERIHDEAACTTCIVRLKNGVNVSQEQLL